MAEIKPFVTRDLADFAFRTGRGDVPRQVVQFIQDDLAALILSAARSSTQAEVEKTAELLRHLGGAPVCSIMFSSRSADPVRAALQNGIQCGRDKGPDRVKAATELAAIWPAALAAAEFGGADGSALIVAVAVGWEVALRLRKGLEPDHEARGFSPVATCGTFGAAVAAALLLGLDRGGLLNALGLAASYAGGLSAVQSNAADDGIAAGLAASAGVEVACLARAGLTGPPDAIEGAQGFGRAVSDTFDASFVVDRLGVEWLAATDASRSSAVTLIKQSLRSTLLNLRPDLNADAWLAKISDLDEIDNASEILIQ
jgi:2-methylcitrate dehydratase PrpD